MWIMPPTCDLMYGLFQKGSFIAQLVLLVVVVIFDSLRHIKLH